MIVRFLIGLIRLYQRYVSPLKAPTCRFVPSCSEYAVQSLRTRGVWSGVFKTSLRILKCHPFHPGGYDPVESGH